MTKGEDQELTQHFDRGSYDKEEEYRPSHKRQEDEKEAPYPEYKYGTSTIMRMSPEVRSRNSYPSGFFNTRNKNYGNSGQGSLASQTFYPAVPRTNIMVGNNIKPLILNENGFEDTYQHWFLCEFVWVMRQVQDEAIKRAQMITTPRGHALDWYMKFYVVQIGVAQKTLDQIREGLIDEFRNPKYKSQFITEIKEIKQLSMEFVWDFDQRFKTLMAKVSFHMLYVQHK